MYRTDAANNSSNLFVDENPGVSPGTTVDAAWLNENQEELCHFVEAAPASVTLVKGTRTQLVTAFINRVTAFLAAGFSAGNVTLTGTPPASSATGQVGKVTTANTVKASGFLTCGAAGAVTVNGGFNIASASWAGTSLALTFATPIPNLTFSFTGTCTTGLRHPYDAARNDNGSGACDFVDVHIWDTGTAGDIGSFTGVTFSFTIV